MMICTIGDKTDGAKSLLLPRARWLANLKRAALFVALVTAVACGGDPNPNPSPNPSPNPNPSPQLGKTGDSCREASECADKLCIHRGGAAIGICTNQCSGDFDCPFPYSNWKCELAGDISMTVCIPAK